LKWPNVPLQRFNPQFFNEFLPLSPENEFQLHKNVPQSNKNEWRAGSNTAE
jgi:hypothetical protein